jgi:hypothetical protein
MKNRDFIELVKSSELYDTEEFIPLHAPVFRGNEKKTDSLFYKGEI